jgi:hypothetical protein
MNAEQQQLELPVEKPPKTLREIMVELLGLYWIAEDNDGVLDEELAVAVEQLEGEFSVKVDKVLMASKSLEGQAMHWKQRADAASATAKALSRKADWLHEYVHLTMHNARIKKIQTEHFPVVALQNNPPSLVIENLQGFLEAYRDDIEMVEVRYEPKKSEAKRRMQAGEEVIGCRLVTDNTHLRVR